MSKRLIFTIMAAGVIVAPLSARQLDPSEALSRAEVYVPAGVRTPLSSGKNQHPMTLKYTATNRTGDLKTVYVFGRGEDNGFVVVAADDVAPSPLLGYADSGTFDASNLPPAMEWWLGEYSAGDKLAGSRRQHEASEYGGYRYASIYSTNSENDVEPDHTLQQLLS